MTVAEFLKGLTLKDVGVTSVLAALSYHAYKTYFTLQDTAHIHTARNESDSRSDSDVGFGSGSEDFRFGFCAPTEDD